jgi:hypothetical protein
MQYSYHRQDLKHNATIHEVPMENACKQISIDATSQIALKMVEQKLTNKISPGLTVHSRGRFDISGFVRCLT